MYTIKMDGQVLYSLDDEKSLVLAPKLSLDVNANGSCSFVIPPGNRLHDAVRRRKSIITVHQDGREIFCGRVLDSEIDQYNQNSVYSEGVRSFLNDSQAAPYTYTGTPRGLLEKLISEHNAQIEPEKQFVLGNVTIDRADEALECENVAYWKTLKEIEEKLLSAYGGYLRVRFEGGVMYLDWLKEYGRTNAQQIRFAVNLLDIKDKNESVEMFTILRPQGASVIGEDGEYNPPVSIASVNGGLDYIQDDDAVAEYGKVWHTQTWPYIEDPAELLEKGREYMKIGEELRTITLRAIDMHFLDGNIEAICIGDKVHIISQPNGIDMEKVCCKIEIDMVDPDKTTYTFGEPLKALTDNIVKAEEEIDSVTGFKSGGGGRSGVQKEMNGILRWAKISVDEANANILLTAGEVNSLKNTMSQAWIEIDGLSAAIKLKASQEEVNELGTRMNSAEIAIDGMNAQILLKAEAKTVDALGTRVSAAEIEIDGLNSQITLKADRIDLQGYVTASQLQTEFTNFESGISDSLYVSALSASGFECSSFDFKGYGMSLKSKSFLTSSTTLTVNATGGTVTGVTMNKKTDTIYYMSWE